VIFTIASYDHAGFSSNETVQLFPQITLIITRGQSTLGGSIVFSRWRQFAPPSITRFLGPTRLSTPNGISIGSAVFARLTIVTDRQTDHVTPSVTIGCICVHSTAMRPNNNANVNVYVMVTMITAIAVSHPVQSMNAAFLGALFL